MCLLIEEYQHDRTIAIQTLDSDGGHGRHYYASGPAVTPTAGSPLAKRLTPVLLALAPDLGVARLDAEKKISRDPEVVRCYRGNPLVYRGRIRARTGAEILAVMQRLPAALSRLSVPLLVLHGTDDQIRPLAGSVMVHEAVSSADKTLRRYPGVYHEVFNEPEREQILSLPRQVRRPALAPATDKTTQADQGNGDEPAMHGKVVGGCVASDWSVWVNCGS
jgi:alpha-beta hydrolase superfamily lysophospholipase